MEKNLRDDARSSGSVSAGQYTAYYLDGIVFGGKRASTNTVMFNV